MADKNKPLPKTTAQPQGIFSGIVNPAGAAIGISAAGYLAFIPVTSYLAGTDSVQNLIRAVAGLIPGFHPLSATGGYSKGMIPALAAIYAFWTYGGSGALSVVGQAMGRTEPYDNDHPRGAKGEELVGFPLRLKSAHMNLMENFTPWALAAALTQVIAPGDTEIVSLLGIGMLLKVGVFYPAYLMNTAAPRTLSHLAANAAFLNVFLRLAKQG